MERIQGPDFPTGALIVGRDGISDAYRTGRGSIRMRAVVNIEEDAKGRTILVVTELPYQVNPDNLVESIAQLHKDGRIAGVADIADESSDRIGMRIVITLKRDSVAKVVLANLFKHTSLQTSFGANMLAIVDGVPRTLRLDQMISFYVAHQVEVIVRRTQYRLDEAEKRAHILRGLVKALDALDEVIALIRRSATVDVAREGLIELLDIDEIQANAILEMQLRRLAALERQKIVDELAEIEVIIADLKDILAKPERQRQIIKDELTEALDKHGDDRRTRLVPYDGDVSVEDLIAVEDVVVTITRTGYAKRTKTDLYRAQRRGGKGVQGAALKQDDIVAHFFVCSTHDWILFFTNKGRVYRAKAYELPEANRNARGPARGEPAGVPAGREDRPGHPDPQLRGGAVPGAGHQGRAGEEERAHRVRLQPVRRDRGDQPAGRRRAGRRGALRLRGGPAADLRRGPVDPVPRHRRGAAADGPGDVRGARHAVQRR